MRTTADYLDALRAHFNTPSDYALQKHTGWRIPQISRYRTGKSTFDDDTAQKVATWLHLPLAEVLIDMNAQRAKSAAVRAAWEDTAKKALGATLAVIVIALAPVLLQNATPGLEGFSLVDQALTGIFAITGNIHYAQWIGLALALWGLHCAGRAGRGPDTVTNVLGRLQRPA